MKKFFKEFKEFALRGSVMDLAIGVIIGAAFQAIAGKGYYVTFDRTCRKNRFIRFVC